MAAGTGDRVVVRIANRAGIFMTALTAHYFKPGLAWPALAIPEKDLSERARTTYRLPSETSCTG